MATACTLRVVSMDKAHMKRAVALARKGIELGHGGPFGAVIVRGGAVVGEGWNEVLRSKDPTAHAEVVAIRNAIIVYFEYFLCTLNTSKVCLKEQPVMKVLIIVTVFSLLAGCGGEGGNGEDEIVMPDDPVMELASDPRVLRLGGIVERTEILLIPGVHVRYSVSALGETDGDTLLQPVSCEGTTCTGLGMTLDLTSTLLSDLIDSDIDQWRRRCLPFSTTYPPKWMLGKGRT